MIEAAERIKVLLRRYMRPEILICTAIVLVLLWVMASYKLNNLYWQRGDAATLYQVTQNIAQSGKATSQVFATGTDFLYDSGLLTLPVDQFASHSLAPPPSLADNPMVGHAYYILYPLALLAKFVPAYDLLLALTVLCFIGMLPIAYFELRARGASIVTAALFCVLVVAHPAWTNGLLYGQAYPDRFFILAGLALMFLASRDRANRLSLVVMAVLCALVDERGALIAGLFMLAYVALYWRRQERDRLFKVGVGAALLLYSAVLFKVVLINPIYANNTPSLNAFFSLLHGRTFDEEIGMLFLANSPFLLLAIFEWRAAVTAVFLMLPNVITNIGGAEKVGWSTHYPSFYFPAVVWAGALGCAALSRYLPKVSWYKFAAAALLAILVVFSVTLDPYSYGKPSWSLANFNSSFFMAMDTYVPQFVGPAGYTQFTAAVEPIRAAIPNGTPTVVTSVEEGMPLLYDERSVKLLYFPLGLDTADYALMGAFQAPGKPVVFYGATTFLGVAEQRKLNGVVIARMKKDGYDFEDAVLVPQLGIAVVKRRRT